MIIALGGDGGDELLLGYDTFIAHRLAEVYERIPKLLRSQVIERAVSLLPVSRNNMSFDFKEFTTDEVKELEGVWVYFDVEETQGVLIARAWNENFMKAFRKFPRGFQTRARMGTISKKKDKEVWHKLLADTILLDWKGVSDEGKVLKYDKKVVVEQLNKYKGLVTFVWEAANEESLYHEEQEEEDEKNSLASFATA